MKCEEKVSKEIDKASELMTDCAEQPTSPKEQKEAYKGYLNIDEQKAQELADIEQAPFSNEAFEELTDEELEKQYEEALNTSEGKRTEQQIALLEQEKERFLKLKFYHEFEDAMTWFENEYPDKDFKELITSEIFTEFASGIKLPIKELISRFMKLSKENESKKIPSPGSIKTSGTVVEKDYFSPAEVDRMSEAEISKNLEKIIKSMKKWK